jgi:hypothetical protein
LATINLPIPFHRRRSLSLFLSEDQGGVPRQSAMNLLKGVEGKYLHNIPLLQLEARCLLFSHGTANREEHRRKKTNDRSDGSVLQSKDHSTNQEDFRHEIEIIGTIGCVGYGGVFRWRG